MPAVIAGAISCRAIGDWYFQGTYSQHAWLHGVYNVLSKAPVLAIKRTSRAFVLLIWGCSQRISFGDGITFMRFLGTRSEKTSESLGSMQTRVRGLCFHYSTIFKTPMRRLHGTCFAMHFHHGVTQCWNVATSFNGCAEYKSQCHIL